MNNRYNGQNRYDMKNTSPDDDNMSPRRSLEYETDAMQDQDDEESEQPKKPAEKVSLLSMAFDIVETLAIATCTIVLLFTFVFRIAIVNGESMNNTLNAGDMLIVTDIGYKPRYGDIVVLQKVDSALGDEAVVKRVIATEGQTVSYNDETNELTVDGAVIDESEYVYIDYAHKRLSDIEYPITLGEGEVFVMGDNRRHSTDSRSYSLGIVDERCIFGHVIARIYPLSDFGFFKRMGDV